MARTNHYPSKTINHPSPIDGRTALLAVIGNPISHSLSPVMHNAALAQLGLNWRYLALKVAAEDLSAAVQGLAAIGCRGVSVTIPHKETIANLVSSIDPIAKQLGAVNCLVPDGKGGWHGTNTDWSGFLAPLQARFPPGATALVLGTGGVVRAVLRSCLELGFKRVLLRGRSIEKLEHLKNEVGHWAPALELLPWETPLQQWLPQVDLVVNGTPLGMGEWQQQSPLSLEQLALLPGNALIYDVVYTPRPTRLLKEAASLGLACQDGLEMLLQQGAAALKLWTGLPQMPLKQMGNAVEQALKQQKP
ncbi:shikimate dehydrogenase [Synechococcus sp.]